MAGAEPLPDGTQDLTRVIGLRREMKESIALEDYEKARENRDAIRSIEDRWIGPSASTASEAPAAEMERGSE